MKMIMRRLTWRQWRNWSFTCLRHRSWRWSYPNVQAVRELGCRPHAQDMSRKEGQKKKSNNGVEIIARAPWSILSAYVISRQMHDLLTCDKRSSKSSVSLQLSKFVVSQQRSATIDVRRHIRVFHMQQHEACEGCGFGYRDRDRDRE